MSDPESDREDTVSPTGSRIAGLVGVVGALVVPGLAYLWATWGSSTYSDSGTGPLLEFVAGWIGFFAILLVLGLGAWLLASRPAREPQWRLVAGLILTAQLGAAAALWVANEITSDHDPAAVGGPPPAPAISPLSSISGADCAESGEPDLDIASEPDWRRHGEYRPWSRQGCLVRIDVLGDRPGPSHCGWESARVIITGSPIGTRYSDGDDTVQFIRDPLDVWGLESELDIDATLPPAAIDTGYRSDGAALWVAPEPDSVIYLVEDGRVEQWPRGVPPLCD